MRYVCRGCQTNVRESKARGRSFSHYIYNIAIGLCTNSTNNNIDGIFLSDIRSDNKLHAVGPLKFLPCSVCGPAVFANTDTMRLYFETLSYIHMKCTMY